MALSSRHTHRSLLLLICAVLLAGWLPAPVAAQTPPAIGIQQATPIRASAVAQAGNVTLLRGSFTLTTPTTDVVLEIFADTRYEAWLNGVWLGRGPARFSRVRQEYDRLPVGDLPAGAHTLAVLVHTNPNLRRSEQIQSGLQAALVGSIAGQQQLLLGTSPAWRALISPAWNPDARQIQSGQLLGKQELLDLRLLPTDWHQPTFNDAGWPLAFAMPQETYPNLQPRSIPPLANFPRAPLAVVSRGVLSPDQQMLDLDGTGSITRTATIALSSSSSITLPITAIHTPTLRLNADPITATWQPLADLRRPDAYIFTTTLPAGSHQLTVAVPPQGTAIGLPTNVQLDASVQQGTDPGRLMQLGEPVTSTLPAPQIILAGGQAQITIPAASDPPQIPAPRYVVLDFGRSIHARIALTATGAAGTIIDAGWDERLVAGHPLPAPGSLHDNQWSHVDSWVLDGTPRQLTTLDTRTGRYLLLVVRGVGSVQIDDLHALEETLVQQVAGSFTSSDARLNQIWQVGVDTLIPNMTDAYADPWRERGQWWGDAYAAQHINRVSVGDLSLWRRGLRQLADDPRPDGILPPFAPRHGEPTVLLDYSLLWVESLYRYWQLTGDTELVRELLPAAERQMQAFRQYENQYGLLDIPADSQLVALAAQPAAPPDQLYTPMLARLLLIDWSGFLSIIGESTPLNALYAASLDWMGAMSAATGRDGLGYTRRAAAVRSAINARLWLPQGGYAATRFEGSLFPPTPQAQAWSLRYGVVPVERRAQTTAVLIDEMTPFVRDDYGFTFRVVEIYGFLWVLDALGQAGKTSAALSLIREHYGRLLDLGATTWWEVFTSNEHQDSALSHGWGGAPTWYLSRYVLGIQQDTAQQWRVAPQPAGFSFARGQAPLADGRLIAVDWTQPACGVLQMQVQAPADLPGTLLVPVAPDRQAATTVTLDGQVVWGSGAPDTSPATATAQGIRVPVSGASRYQIEQRTPCQPVLWLPLVVRGQ